MTQADDLILQSIKVMLDRSAAQIPYDSTSSGRIIAVLGNNRYTVESRGTTFTIPACTETVYAVSETVWLCKPEGSEENMFILGRKR